MPLTFNTLLADAGFDPADVRLLRHMDHASDRSRTPYHLWRDDRPSFESYQALQSFGNRRYLRAPYWASFVGTPTGDTLFAGLYRVRHLGPLRRSRPKPHMEGTDRKGSCDEYALRLIPAMREYDGKVVITWGTGYRRWIQRADRKPKPIVEIRATVAEPPFPGFLRIREPLSRVAAESLPRSWIEVLKSSRGVYLLTCPRTKEHYVGSATGAECFWQRWQDHARNRGAAVRLRSRDPSDYFATILEVAGSSATRDEIVATEHFWMEKLHTRSIGLNS